jgi:hypothetical protein
MFPLLAAKINREAELEQLQEEFLQSANIFITNDNLIVEVARLTF